MFSVLFDVNINCDKKVDNKKVDNKKFFEEKLLKPKKILLTNTTLPNGDILTEWKEIVS